VKLKKYYFKINFWLIKKAVWQAFIVKKIMIYDLEFENICL